ncbi:peptidase inhibitor family I36 protein [Pseudonocardia alaniniphila]|uniref:Peptidase inhibitor family I36 protein n=2 Tax=Pseudonocardia alaniniphila TaxID=75291 RepID=A0ABS9TNX7_9PSEU|nr:peptidase inhibitor family I36 protein [Pseudonocardia alaniniphila]MCH6170245.1 peptidase inhibitor family I36 protein [Pseudonocardia alaniniphila]
MKKLIRAVRYGAVAVASLAALTACSFQAAAPSVPLPQVGALGQVVGSSPPPIANSVGQVQVFGGPTTGTLTLPTNHGAAPSIQLQAVNSPQIGVYVTDSAGMTLYRSAADSTNPPQSTCDSDCAATFPPLVVGPSAKIYTAGVNASSVGYVQRSDGTYQVTINGSPMYYYWQDQQPGQINGQGVADNWSTVSPTGGSAASGRSSGGQSSGGQSSGSGSVDGRPNELTVYEGANFRGEFTELEGGFSNFATVDLNDKITSIANNTGQDMCFWTDANFQGSEVKVPAGVTVAQLSQPFDDKISSEKQC